jgi:hypothetical protein
MFTNTDPNKPTINSSLRASLVKAMHGSSRDKTVPANAYTPEHAEERRQAERQSPQARMRRQIQFVRGKEKEWFMFLSDMNSSGPYEHGVDAVCRLLGSDTSGGFPCEPGNVSTGNYFQARFEGSLGDTADGPFRRKLIDWQKAHGLEEDGLLGADTAMSMYDILYSDRIVEPPSRSTGVPAGSRSVPGEPYGESRRTRGERPGQSGGLAPTGGIDVNSLMKKISSERNYSIMRSVRH